MPRTRPLPERFWEKVAKTTGDGCWLWTSSTRGKAPYGTIWTTDGVRSAHRVSWELANGRTVPARRHVLHKCDVPLCVRPDHLFDGTARDNMRDMRRKGRNNDPRGERHGSRTHPDRLARGDRHSSRTHPERTARGERHGCAKLTAGDVETIRVAHAVYGTTGAAMARAWGMDRETFRKILNGRLWKHTLVRVAQ